MYTFKRPQHQLPPQQTYATGAEAFELDANTALQTDCTAPGDTLVDGTHPTHEQQQPQPQPCDGTLPEDASDADVLQYCRGMIMRNQMTSPPHWRRVRTVLPASVAELRLTPSAPEWIQQTHPITPSPCIVMQLDGCLPEGMTVKEYMRDLVKYVFELLAYQRASTAITSLRFVKIGTELTQLVVTFGRDVQLATRMLEELAAVGFIAGFGQSNIEDAPNATFQITDYHFSMNNGKGITSDDITGLLEPTRPPLGINVIEGYEPGVFYAAVKRSDVVYAWLWNPFNSFVVQHTLFERFGVVLTMAACPHEFLIRGISSATHPQNKHRLKRRGDDGNMDFDEGLPDENEDEGEEEGPGAMIGGDETTGEQRKSLAWSHNAEEEIDIFGGLDQSDAGNLSSRVDLHFVDKDITELLHSAKVEQQQQEKQQQEQYGLYSEPQAYPLPYSANGSLPPPQHAAYVQPPYNHGLYYAAHDGSWMPQQQQQQQQQQQPPPHEHEEAWRHYGSVAENAMPLHYAPSTMHAYGIPPNPQPAIKYPELVDDNDTDCSNKNNIAPMQVDCATVDDAPLPTPHGYWDGEYPPASTYGGPAFFPPGMPSILGQPTYGTQYNNTSGSPGSRAILAIPPPTVMRTEEADVEEGEEEEKKNTAAAECVLSLEMAAQHAERLFELMQAAFPPVADVPDTEPLDEEEKKKAMPMNPEENLSFCLVPFDAVVPRPTAELVGLLSFLTEQSATLTAVLESPAAELQETRRRIALLLLTTTTTTTTRAASERDDWTLIDPDERGNAGEEECPTAHLPALLPYLLATGEGAYLAAALAEHHTAHTLPLLARYALPFILDPRVVQSVLTTALRADPSAGNPLVRRIICHWGSLATWIQARIQFQSGTNAEIDAQKTAANSAVSRKLISQVGKTMDMLLTAMSSEQREVTRVHLEDTNAVIEFAKTLNVTVGGGEEAKPELPTLSSLWGSDGVVHRSLLRLYLNANVISGAAVVKALFEPLPHLLRDHYYYILVALSKSLVSPTLSEETGRLCGGFLRLMEHHTLNMTRNDTEEQKDDNGVVSEGAAASHSALTEKDALHLVDAAMRAVGSVEVYQCLRDAYLEVTSSASHPVRRFEKVEKMLSSSTPPVNSHPSQPSVSKSGAILGPSTSYHQHQQHQQQQQHQEHKNSEDNNNHRSATAWHSEWTGVMRNYPPFGEPFTPLPTGWSSSLSRSYGHYYFKDSVGTASYKHPTDATEFMATPQAFLQEPSSGFSLDDVLGQVSESLGPDVVTREQAEAWLQDQRVRVEALDMAVLALLKITYRSGGRKRSERYGDDEQSRSTHTAHRRVHSPGEIQKKLAKLHTYPPRGHPFKPLPRNWTCNLSSSNGLYYFRPPRGSPVYQHPTNGREYRASPQAFVLHRQIHSNAVAVEAQRSLQEVEEWMADQRRRDEVLDAAVVRMIPIHYATSADYDDVDDEREDDGGSSRVRSDRRASTPRKKHSRR